MHPHGHDMVFRFCPLCGGTLEARLLKTSEPDRPVCTACGFVLYLDPKVAVGTIIEAGDNRIVLVRRALDPGYGKWVFPGGYVDRGEELPAAAIREAREESGLEVRIDGLVNIYSYARPNTDHHCLRSHGHRRRVVRRRRVPRRGAVPVV